MHFYLFDTLLEDDTAQGLVDFVANPTPQLYFEIFPTLMKFSSTSAISEFSVREYLFEQALLRFVHGDCIAAPESLPYLQADAENLYTLAFEVDWDALCQRLNVLPFPHRKKSGEPTTCYQEELLALCHCSSAQALAQQLIYFYQRYADVEEAKYQAFRWESGQLVGLERVDPIVFDQLGGLDTQKAALVENTQSFLEGKPANNVLLVGGSGTGKSSCVKATFNHFKNKGLRMVELTKQDLEDVSLLMEELRYKKQHYIIYIDDLSFESADHSYIQLKVALDGQLEPNPPNVLLYATSNRRRLMQEHWSDRQGVEDLHLHDTLHEKMSLSERFGIRLYFGMLSQKEYFAIIEMMLEEYQVEFTRELGVQAATWASTNNGRSGRTARQFVNYYLAQVL